MSPTPDPLLSNTLLTDSYADGLHAARERLHTLMGVAGIQLHLGYPDETPRADLLPLGTADERTVAELAAHICPAVDGAERTAGILHAIELLQSAASQAGLALQVGEPQVHQGGSGRVQLGLIDHATVTALAALIEHSCTSLVEAAGALDSALSAIDVTASAIARGGAVHVNEITVPEGVVLLRHLAPENAIGDIDPDGQAAGEDLADRLDKAVKAMTGGIFDAAYSPYCRKCSESPSLLFEGRLKPSQAPGLPSRAQST
ncbi:hypothetical protein [Actinacidiphila rubida]|uniref:Uncharacterized protein n=1 Tax=Actinacidiphila rubida TaxID=310780 RepID=A0A1H8TSI5_9ACTN|nr:hypothetical protein [Actinacidiphila rubida]SEO93398.1 hypothetical protein SAMN05216267_105716 [Actinacidiphila rubida]